MTVGELAHGRGTPMSAHELGAVWPAFYRHQHREAERDRARQSDLRAGRQGRTF